ncbi:PQQ-dependent sugar dehydrogenase [Lacinutrix sp. C3R15]|uniref:PQQ-dependent sugar dehydrogenase n=1 Tax=Flavobacteriaceae TaxID=49546 RepID=UPI001C088ED9|nr:MULTISPECIES: PQQ-dependent sugar dehydrogenase [Flavobacteriaceae]MBU2940641.1 PQQ-dependent sugar dehydrogenase [Lacinutrix sp. C3R15]MDO6623959.1 PQQ-dependent sugar dehydrogenase [Oceanihabitans sp. 1_MG-2023]
MKPVITILLALFSVLCFSQNINIELFSSGLSSPVNIKHAGDNRLFVAEKSGIIKIVSPNGTILNTPFLDINTLVRNSGSEQGLLAMVFHPDYLNNGYLYVNYINDNGDTVISRFTRSTINTADADSELEILSISQPFSNHNGGDMHFGTDGYLYISTGDGGSGGDPGNRAQDLTTLLGKLLRIDVDQTSSTHNYAIPADNPFYGASDGIKQEIWAYGLRNPWKWSFDRDTGDIWIADVGQNQIEEINMVTGGSLAVNYGWRCYEGNATYNTTNCPSSSSLTFPVAQYTHSNDGAFKCSITGGYRYRGTAQPTLQGLYFFADYCSDEIGYVQGNGNSFNLTFIDDFGSNGFSAFAEDINGELYITGLSSGNIYKIIDADLSTEEQSIFKLKIYPNPTKDSLNFDFRSTRQPIKEINVFNLQGKLVRTIFKPNNNITTIDTKKLQSGLYLIKVIAENGAIKTSKFIKD